MTMAELLPLKVYPVMFGASSLRKEFAPLGANSFKSRPYFERDALVRKANRKSLKLFPFVKMVEKHRDVLIHLKVHSKVYKYTSKDDYHDIKVTMYPPPLLTPSQICS